MLPSSTTRSTSYTRHLGAILRLAPRTQVLLNELLRRGPAEVVAPHACRDVPLVLRQSYARALAGARSGPRRKQLRLMVLGVCANAAQQGRLLDP